MSKAVPLYDSSPDERFMRRAIELAANVPAFPFGALLVDPENNIVAEGFTDLSHRLAELRRDEGATATPAGPSGRLVRSRDFH